MKLKMSNFKLGLFIIVGTALLFFLVVLFGAGAFSAKGLEIETYVDGSVQGLEVGSPLKFRGVRIGRVTEINLLDQHYPSVTAIPQSTFVIIMMELDPHTQRLDDSTLTKRVETWVDQGMRLRVASQGITGLAFMEAEFVQVNPDEEMDVTWTPKHLYIPSARTQLARVAASIESIARDLENANLPEIAGNVEKLLTKLNEAVGDADIKGVSDSVRTTLERLETVAAAIEEAVTGVDLTAMAESAANALDEIEVAVKEARTSIDDVTQGLTKTLDESNLAIGDARQYLADPEIKDAIGRIASLADRMDAILVQVEGSVTAQDQRVTQILSDMRATSNNFRELSTLLARYPSVVPFGSAPPPPEAYDK